jgi:hypothetical protein
VSLELNQENNTLYETPIGSIIITAGGVSLGADRLPANFPATQTRPCAGSDRPTSPGARCRFCGGMH